MDYGSGSGMMKTMSLQTQRGNLSPIPVIASETRQSKLTAMDRHVASLLAMTTYANWDQIHYCPEIFLNLQLTS
jgi:hypothetical protein